MNSFESCSFVLCLKEVSFSYNPAFSEGELIVPMVKGNEPHKLEFPGNGLINMKKRMNDIGGDIIIKSKSGFGTEIKLFISLE